MILQIRLRAGALTCRLEEVCAKKATDEFVWLTNGEADRIDNGYVRYFGHDERDRANKWIVERHEKIFGTKRKQEEIREIKDENISDKERKTGKLRRNEKRRVRGNLSGG